MSSQQQAAERVTKLIADVDSIQKRLAFVEEEIERLKRSVQEMDSRQQIEEMLG